MNKPDIYSYVASDRSKAMSILNSFGYAPRNNNMAINLKALVASEGEPALKAIVDAHPDKDLILEMHAPDQDKHVQCKCQDCLKKDLQYFNADGFLNSNDWNKDSGAKNVKDNFSLIFLAGTMLITVAILSKN